MRGKLAVASTLLAMGVLLLSPRQAAESCRYGLRLCCELIIPSLFPFFVLSMLLNKLGFPAALGKLLSPGARRLFGVSGAGCSALMMGLCGGYPMGAAYIADMHHSGMIDAEECEQLLGFCNNSGPAFIIGAVGAGAFGSAKVGLMLYGVHIISALCTGLIMRRSDAALASPLSLPEPLPFSAAFSETVKQAVISVLNVCGFAVFFTMLTGLLDAGGHFSQIAGRISALMGTELTWSRALLTGLLELGSGGGAMRGMAVCPINLALAAFLLGWGGVSVHYQTMALFVGTNTKSVLHFAGRLISASIGAVLAYWLGMLLF